jgi:hypothetical protein
MTQSVNCEIFGLDRFGLVSPPHSGLETIRNQKLPKAITNQRESLEIASAMSAYFGGKTDLARRVIFYGIPDGQDDRTAGSEPVP